MPTSPIAFLKPDRYDPPSIAVIKAIPGMSWSRELVSWVGYPDAVAAATEALLYRGKDGRAVAAGVVGTVVTPDDLRKSHPEADHELLRDYQRLGVDLVASTAHLGTLLADDVGLGKTCQALLAAKALAPKTVLVVCPAVLKPVWVDEVTKWVGDYFVPVVLKGTKAYSLNSTVGNDGSGRTRVFIINYDVIHAWVDVFVSEPPSVLILDECHFLQSDRSRRSIAVKKVARVSPYRIALSATPMQVRPKDLWNVLDTLCEGRWGKTAWKFFVRHCDAHMETVAKDTTIWNLDGHSNEQELAFRLSWTMLRRSKADVMSELPLRTRQIVSVEVDDAAIAPMYLKGWGSAPKRLLIRALTLSGTGKVNEAVQLATSRVKEGHSVVVYSYERATARVIFEKLWRAEGKGGVGKDNAFLITGADPPEQRAVVIKGLRERGADRPSALSATMDSIGVGVDLSHTDVVIFVDLHWVPTKLLQCEGRSHRHGLANPLTIYFLIGIGTADEYVRDKVIRRLDLFEKVIGHADEAGELRCDLDPMESKGEEELLRELRELILAHEGEDDDND